MGLETGRHQTSCFLGSEVTTASVIRKHDKTGGLANCQRPYHREKPPIGSTAGNSWEMALRDPSARAPTTSTNCFAPGKQSREQQKSVGTFTLLFLQHGINKPQALHSKPLDQGKIELNKANYVLLMVVYLLKI